MADTDSSSFASKSEFESVALSVSSCGQLSVYGHNAAPTSQRLQSTHDGARGDEELGLHRYIFWCHFVSEVLKKIGTAELTLGLQGDQTRLVHAQSGTAQHRCQ